MKLPKLVSTLVLLELFLGSQGLWARDVSVASRLESAIERGLEIRPDFMAATSLWSLVSSLENLDQLNPGAMSEGEMQEKASFIYSQMAFHLASGSMETKRDNDELGLDSEDIEKVNKVIQYGFMTPEEALTFATFLDQSLSLEEKAVFLEVFSNGPECFREESYRRLKTLGDFIDYCGH